ncbi:MAG: hypothetical protein KDD62_04915 [Bdellovibrionales bacterium]|nr:hypothetical protein [Bdellovibrionales bacterium]
MKQIVITPEMQKRHDEATAQGKDYYKDPQSGYMVFTAEYHRRRGHCCKSGCRHCPYTNNRP